MAAGGWPGQSVPKNDVLPTRTRKQSCQVGPWVTFTEVPLGIHRLAVQASQLLQMFDCHGNDDSRRVFLHINIA